VSVVSATRSRASSAAAPPPDSEKGEGVGPGLLVPW
jgi:hypothetical protein